MPFLICQYLIPFVPDLFLIFYFWNVPKTDEFKMLILELLEEGRTKKSLENEYGIITAEYTVK